LAGSLKDLYITIAADVEKAQAALKGIQQGLKNTGKTAEQSSTRFMRAMKKISASTQRANRWIQQHSTAFRIAGMAITGTLGMVTRGALRYGVQIDKMMKQTGMSAEALSRMAYAAEQEHASIEVLERSLVRLARTMQYTIVSPSSEYSKAFEEMGIRATDSSGRLRDASQVFAEIADWMASTTDSTKRAAVALTLFGRGGRELLPFLRLGGDALRRLYAEADQLGITLSGDAARAAKAFDDQLTKLRFATRGVGIALASFLIPRAQRLVERISDVIVSFRDWNEKMGGTPLKIAAVAAGVAGLALVGLPSLAKAITFVVAGFTSLATLIASHPFLAGLLAIVGIGTMLYVKWKPFRDLINTLPERLKFLKDLFVLAGKTAAKELKVIGELISNIAKKVYDWMVSNAKHLIALLTRYIQDALLKIVNWLYDKLPGFIGGPLLGRIKSALEKAVLLRKPLGEGAKLDLGISEFTKRLAELESQYIQARAKLKQRLKSEIEEATREEAKPGRGKSPQEAAREAAASAAAIAQQINTTTSAIDRQIAALRMRLSIGSFIKELYADENLLMSRTATK